MDHDEIVSTFFRALDNADRSYVLEAGIRRTFGLGEYVLRAGEDPVSVHLVLNGAFKLVISDARATQAILGIAAEDDVLGDIAALDGRPHPFDAVCVSAGQTFALDSVTFTKVLERNARAAVEMSSRLASKTRLYARSAFERSRSSVDSRVASSILDLADSVGRMKDRTIEVEMPFAQGDLAQLAGTSRESVCKTMNHLRSKGVLAYRGRRLRILRPDLLERIRCGEASRGSTQIP